MNFLWYLFIVSCIYQIVYQLVLVFAIIKNQKTNSDNYRNANFTILKSVSVIICAKNEAENLQKNLPFILEQNYANFEIIIVDDGSDILLTMNDERLAIINLTNAEKIGLGKKYALQKGIEAAKNELILLTDADCQPLSKNWIREMAGCVNDKHKIVLGISPYKTENTILNSLIEYETAQTALQYVGFALLKNPYMSVGRNVLYDAALLKSKIWTTQELSIASGDDDLTIQTLATKENTTVCLSKDSYTVSKAKDSWSAWIQQKLRHYESGSMYRFSHRLFLGSYLFKKMILYSVLLFFICNGFKIFFTIPSASSFFLKCCFYAPCFFMLFCICFTFFINYILNKKLQLNKRWYFAVFNDLLYCIFTIMLGLISQFKTTKNWK